MVGLIWKNTKSILLDLLKFPNIEDNFKRNNFPFGKEFKFQMDFEIRIHEKIKFQTFLHIKGFEPLRRTSINSPKIFLDMIFKTVILD
jgi:hypothetical protein